MNARIVVILLFVSSIGGCDGPGKCDEEEEATPAKAIVVVVVAEAGREDAALRRVREALGTIEFETLSVPADDRRLAAWWSRTLEVATLAGRWTGNQTRAAARAVAAMDIYGLATAAMIIAVLSIGVATVALWLVATAR